MTSFVAPVSTAPLGTPLDGIHPPNSVEMRGRPGKWGNAEVRDRLGERSTPFVGQASEETKKLGSASVARKRGSERSTQAVSQCVNMVGSLWEVKNWARKGESKVLISQRDETSGRLGSEEMKKSERSTRKAMKSAWAWASEETTMQALNKESDESWRRPRKWVSGEAGGRPGNCVIQGKKRVLQGNEWV